MNKRGDISISKVVKTLRSNINEIYRFLSGNDMYKKTLDHSSIIQNVLETGVCNDINVVKLKNHILLLLREELIKIENHNKLIRKYVKQHLKLGDNLVKGNMIQFMGNIMDKKFSKKVAKYVSVLISSECTYVRKSAVLALIKIYLVNHKIFTKKRFDNRLSDLLNDPNDIIVVNACAALREIFEYSRKHIVVLSNKTLEQLVERTQRFKEWEKVQVYNFFYAYARIREAKLILGHIMDHTSYPTPALAIASVRLICKFCEKDVLGNAILSLNAALCDKAEINFILYRAILIILERYYDDNFRSLNFHYKINDGDLLSIKLTKLNINYTLFSEDKDALFLYLKRYTTHKESVLASRALELIGRLSLQDRGIAENSIRLIEKLLYTDESKSSLCVIILSMILRQYPCFDEHVTLLAQCVCKELSDEAKETMLWMMGEFHSLIKNFTDIFEALFNINFVSEPIRIQLAILNACMKCYVHTPNINEKTNANTKKRNMLEKIFSLSINDCDNQTLRRQAFFYFNLLRYDMEYVKLHFQKLRPIDVDEIEITIRKDFMENISYHIGRSSSFYNHFPSFLYSERKENLYKNADVRYDIPLIHNGLLHDNYVDIRADIQCTGENKRELRIQVINLTPEVLNIEKVRVKENVMGLDIQPIFNSTEIKSLRSKCFNFNLKYNKYKQSGGKPSEIKNLSVLVSSSYETILVQIPLVLKNILQDPVKKDFKDYNKLEELIKNAYEVLKVEHPYRNAFSTFDFRRHNLFVHNYDYNVIKFVALSVNNDEIISYIKMESDVFEIGTKSASNNLSILVNELIANIYR